MTGFTARGVFEEHTEATSARLNNCERQRMPAEHPASGSWEVGKLGSVIHHSNVTASPQWSISLKDGDCVCDECASAPGPKKRTRLASMLLSSLLVFLAFSFSALGFRSGLGLQQRTLNPQEAVLSDNLTDQVQWDEFSLIVRGQRVFL